MKVCRKCGLERSEEDFYSGRRKCRFCCVEYSKAWQAKNIKKRNASIRRWHAKNPARIRYYRKVWEDKNKEKNREIDLAHARRWRKRNRAYINKKAAERRKADPVRERARDAINNAIQRGKISRPKSCERCGVVCRTHGHHPDYLKRLEVIWLCPKCHVAVHRIEGRSL